MTSDEFVSKRLPDARALLAEDQAIILDKGQAQQDDSIPVKITGVADVAEDVVATAAKVVKPKPEVVDWNAALQSLIAEDPPLLSVAQLLSPVGVSRRNKQECLPVVPTIILTRELSKCLVKETYRVELPAALVLATVHYRESRQQLLASET